VSPFDAESFGAVFAHWPQALRPHTTFHPVDSMAFFMLMAEQRIRPGLVLVDGKHDYEYALFDIQSAARWITSGGFIFVDNVEQAGPFRAAAEFLAAHPEWRSCGDLKGPFDDTKAFDRHRTSVTNTGFFVLRAPTAYFVGRAPRSFGEVGWHGLDLDGLTIVPAHPAPTGTLKIQCVLRAFAEARQVEIIAEADCVIDGRAGPIQVRLPRSWEVEGGFRCYSVETWLCWLGAAPLALDTPPIPF
jgi:hypothetical protein